MIKSIYTFLFLTFSISLVIGQEAKPKIVVSASIFNDMVKNIGGHLVDVESIVPVGSDPHLYEPTPKDARLVQNASLIMINGLTFEGWISELVENSGTNAEMIRITEGIDAIASHQYKNAFDPHVWMDLSNGLIYAKNIKNALSKLDPKNKGAYEKNYMAYTADIKDLDLYINKEIQKIPNQQRVLITSHDAFAYYGRKYGLKLNAIMGISTEAEAQTSDIMRVTKAIEDSGVPAIFVESTINPKLLKQIAADHNVKIGGELFADSLGPKGSEGDTYLKMLRHNTDVIVAALSKVKTENTDKPIASSDNNFALYLIIGLVLLFSILFAIFKFK